MKKNQLIILTCICICTISITNTTQQSPIKRAKNMLNGVKPYRKKVLNLLYDFLRSANLSTQAINLKNSMNKISDLKAQINTTVENTLAGTEKMNYQLNKRNLYNNRVRMNAKVLDETNKLFNTIDNITSNASQEIINYRKEKSRALPEITKIQNLITKHKQAIDGLEKQLKIKIDQLNPKLKEYYNKMKADTQSLFVQVKNLGQKITSKAKTFENAVLSLNATIEKTKKQKAGTLMQTLNASKKNRDAAFQQTRNAVDKLSEAEKVRWGTLRDLYNRVELIEQTIMYGSAPITQWKLPSHILRITPPK